MARVEGRVQACYLVLGLRGSKVWEKLQSTLISQVTFRGTGVHHASIGLGRLQKHSETNYRSMYQSSPLLRNNFSN